MSYPFECMQCRRSWTSRHVPEAEHYSYKAITRKCRRCQSEVSLERVKYLCMCGHEWETFRNDEGLSCNRCGTTVLPNSEEHSGEVCTKMAVCLCVCASVCIIMRFCSDLHLHADLCDAVCAVLCMRGFCKGWNLDRSKG